MSWAGSSLGTSLRVSVLKGQATSSRRALTAIDNDPESKEWIARVCKRSVGVRVKDERKGRVRAVYHPPNIELTKEKDRNTLRGMPAVSLVSKAPPLAIAGVIFYQLRPNQFVVERH